MLLGSQLESLPGARPQDQEGKVEVCALAEISEAQSTQDRGRPGHGSRK